MNNGNSAKRNSPGRFLKEKTAVVLEQVPVVGRLLAAIARVWGLKELGFFFGGFLLALALLYFGRLPQFLRCNKPEDISDLVGLWTWQYAEEGLRVDLNFSLLNGNLVFEGTGFQNRQPLFRITNGNAQLRSRGLDMQCTVRNLKNGDELHWETVEPLARGRNFTGALRSEYTNHPDFAVTNWGVALYRPAR